MIYVSAVGEEKSRQFSVRRVRGRERGKREIEWVRTKRGLAHRSRSFSWSQQVRRSA